MDEDQVSHSRSLGWSVSVSVAAGAASGLLAFLSDFPVHAWWLQAVAFLPLLWALGYACQRVWIACLAGMGFALPYCVPLLRQLDFPVELSLALGGYTALLWIAFSAVAYGVSRWASPWGPLAVGAAATAIEWVDVSLVSAWGTTQCYARVWTAAPWAIQFASITGILGVVFVLIASQALIASLIGNPSRRSQTAVALTVLLVVAASHGLWSWKRSPKQSIRVAAIGWNLQGPGAIGRSTKTDRFRLEVAPRAREAARQGARIVVTPEAGFAGNTQELQATLAAASALARELKIMLAIGYFDQAHQVNQLAIFDPTGTRRATYTKTHLVPMHEKYTPGKGERVVVEIDGIKVGGMICQDDNFTDLSRGYAQDRVQLVVVPTNDWREVKDYHFEGSRLRALDGGYGIVRAASNGISAIVSPRGATIASVDHLEQGPSVLTADLPIDAGGAPYGRLGNWLGPLAGATLLIGIALRWSRPRKAEQSNRTES